MKRFVKFAIGVIFLCFTNLDSSAKSNSYYLINLDEKNKIKFSDNIENITDPCWEEDALDSNLGITLFEINNPSDYLGKSLSVFIDSIKTKYRLLNDIYNRNKSGSETQDTITSIQGFAFYFYFNDSLMLNIIGSIPAEISLNTNKLTYSQYTLDSKQFILFCFTENIRSKVKSIAMKLHWKPIDIYDKNIINTILTSFPRSKEIIETYIDLKSIGIQ